jgi:hypothetical protein
MLPESISNIVGGLRQLRKFVFEEQKSPKKGRFGLYLLT